MDLVPDLLNAFVVVAMGFLITFVTRNQIQDLKAEVKDVKDDVQDLRNEVKQDIRGLRTEMNDRFREQGGEIAALRSDVTQLALALIPRPKPETA